MNDFVIYDKASFHYGAESFPIDLPKVQAFVHTGFFLGWLIKNNLISESFVKDWHSEIYDFLAGSISGVKLFQIIDGSLTSEDLNVEGNNFASYYYSFENGAKYIHDYEEIFVEYSNLYAVPDSIHNFEKICIKITKRFRLWKMDVNN